MIYLENITSAQAIWIPRDSDAIGSGCHGGGGGDCDYCYNVGYEDGLADGEDKQRKRLGHLDVTENGNYNNANSGWSSVTVTVPQTGHTQQEIDDAYQSGMTYQKSLLGSTAITTNTTVMNGNGWSAVTVNVPNRYNEGYADGVNHQKSLLTTTAVTENGTYTSENGFEEVSVNVPQNNPAIEQNKGFTATTNGTSSITPSAIWEIEYEPSRYNTHYYFTINGNISSGYYGHTAYRLDYHDFEDYGYVLIKIDQNGGLELDTSNYDQETEPVNLYYINGKYDFVGSNISASNFTVHPLDNVEYYYAMSSVALTVDVPPQGALIEHSKSYTATTNGSHTITPTGTWEVTCDTSRDDYYLFTIEGVLSGSQYVHRQLYRLDYNGEEDYGYILVVVNDNGDNLGLDINHYDQESHPVGYRNESDGTHFYGNPASAFTVTPLDYKEELYDAMDSVELTVNVDMTEAYNSGYTAGEDAITSTFTSLTVNQNGNYGSSAHPITALTVNVTETYGELYCLYCEDAVFHINSGNGITNSVTLSRATAKFYGDFIGRFYLGDSDLMAIWSASQHTSGGSDYLLSSVYWGHLIDANRAHISASTPNTQSSFVDMNTLMVNRVQKLGLYVDGWQMGELVTAPVVSGNNFTFNMYGYLKSININNNYCGLLPFVDSEGNAGLVWNGTRIYPTSGNCYPVYKKTVGGVDKYIVVGNLTV